MDTAKGAPGTETHPFQAEMKQLLDIFVRSLYSSKEVFLRELVSNASDALDRLRFEALTQPGLRDDGELEIRIEADPETRTLSILDNGIGMSREEVIANIGTIARSGTRELVQKIKESKTSEQTLALIGQFGVGFYSAFMVADKVSLRTRRAGTAGTDDATLWESTGDGTYTVGPASKEDRGTAITLHLKPVDRDDGIPDFTDEWVLGGIVKKYSDFVRYPIRTKVSREVVERDEEGIPKKDAPKKTIVEDKTLNSMKAIWLRKPQDVKEDEYHDFYKHISHDWEKPLKVITFNAEGRLEYRALLFVPSRAPFDYGYTGVESGGLQLFAQNVKIVEKCGDLLPHYLRFVKGVVDSSDLSLNISREMLQQDRQIAQIRKGLTKKILDVLVEMQEKEADTYRKLWNAFGRAIKEGAASDHENREKLLRLLLLESSATDAEKLTTLEEYATRLKEGQEEIYYLTGESRSLIESSPHLEVFKAKGYEVLYLTDPVDDYMMQSVSEFGGKKLRSAASATLSLSGKEEPEKEKEEQKRKDTEASYAKLLETMQQRLDQHVKEVRLSTRLTSSPVCLVGEGTMTPRLERLLGGRKRGSSQRRIMELNPDHAVLKQMKAHFEKNRDDSRIGDYAELLLGQALLLEGSDLPDPAKFSHLVADLMTQPEG
ncbi:MAG: molecular chaperone HtpG [Pseudomonadota bacterium]